MFAKVRSVCLVVVLAAATLALGTMAGAQQYGLPPGYVFEAPQSAGGTAGAARLGPMDNSCVAARIWCDDALTTDAQVVLTPTTYVVDETTTMTTATLILYTDRSGGVIATSFTLLSGGDLLTVRELVDAVNAVAGWRAEIQAALGNDALSQDDGSSHTTCVLEIGADSTSATLCRTLGSPIIWNTGVTGFHRVTLGPEQVTGQAPWWVRDLRGALTGQSGIREVDPSGRAWTDADYIVRLRYLRAGAVNISTATLAVYAARQDTPAGAERLVATYAAPGSGAVTRVEFGEEHARPGERYILTFGGQVFRGAVLEAWGWAGRRE